jgi:hypothetical protein
MSKTLINIILFQIGWFACVLGGASDNALYGVLIAITIILFHLFSSSEWRSELILVIAAMIIGFSWDSYLVYKQWIAYPHGQLIAGTAPYWIVTMWALFTITFNNSLNWLKDRIIVSIIFGAIGGPLAYFAGARLGALEFQDTTSGLIALAVGWAILTPLLLQLSSYLNGFSNKAVRSKS